MKAATEIFTASGMSQDWLNELLLRAGHLLIQINREGERLPPEIRELVAEWVADYYRQEG